MALLQGSTFVNQSSPILKSHLWVIISDTSLSTDKVVIANVTTWRDIAIHLNDESCIINKGEHGFIEHKSYVNYKETVIVSVDQLQKLEHLLKFYEACNPELLEKILLGATISMHTPNEAIAILQAQEIID